MFCLYLHKKPDDTIFYVGIGTPKRAYAFQKRNNFWNNVVKKYGYPVVEIVAENLSWENACIWEKLFIFFYGRRNLGLGSLVNLTEGGDGTTGYKFSDESKKRMSIIHKNPSEETRSRIGESLKKAYRDGRKIPPGTGHKWSYIPSDETRKKISESNALTWSQGKISGNKGRRYKLSPFSEEHKNKISVTRQKFLESISAEKKSELAKKGWETRRKNGSSFGGRKKKK